MKRVPVSDTGYLSPLPPESPPRLILYVEDDEDNRQVASMRLERQFQLVFASTDREACEAFIHRGREFDLILMDIELRGSRLNGIDLTRLVRGTLDKGKIPFYGASVPKLDTPIIFVTAYGQLYRSELLEAGGNDIIEKPISFAELQSSIARVSDQQLE
ncbi:MAG: response regulator [Deltaproteobacteria bacterium]|nr:response regulator [Deltaproteobacteria bacterium]